MELRQLTVFLAVTEEGSFTAAARRVGVVQSAVSSAVRALEDDLGQELFDRTARGVELTDAGRALLPEARRAVAAFDAARDAVDAVRGGLRGTVRLGSMHALVLQPIRVPQLLARFRAEHPQVEVRLLHGPTSMEKIRQVRDGQLDLALVGLTPPAPPGVALVELQREPMHVLCHRDHPVARRSWTTLDALADEAFVDGPPGSASRATTDAAFTAAGVGRSVAYEINDTSGMVDLMAAGLAIAVLPPRVAAGRDDVTFVPLRPAPPVLRISLAMPGNRPIGAAARALSDRLRAEARDGAQAPGGSSRSRSSA